MRHTAILYFYGASLVLACQSTPRSTSQPPIVAIPAPAPTPTPTASSGFAFAQGGLRLEYLFEPDPDAPPDALAQARRVIQKWLDSMGVKGHVAITDKRIVVDLLGTTTDTMESIRAQIVVGKLEFREVEDSVGAPDKRSPGTLDLPATMTDGTTKMVRLRAGGIGPDSVEDAELRVSEYGVAVDVRMNATGAAAFEKLTRDNIDKPIAIVLGAKILTMPVVKTPITGGRVQITMGGSDLDKQHADGEALVRALKAGVLRGKLVLESEYVVQPPN